MISDGHAGSHLFSPLTGLLTRTSGEASLENRGLIHFIDYFWFVLQRIFPKYSYAISMSLIKCLISAGLHARKSLAITVVLLVHSYELYRWRPTQISRSKTTTGSEPTTGSEATTGSEITTSSKITTWRVRNIPLSFTREKLQKILEELSNDAAEVHIPGPNILQLCLAPSFEQYSTATVTFQCTPKVLEPLEALGMGGDLNGLKFDTTFLDITTLYEPDVPQLPVVEYILPERIVLGMPTNGLLSYSIVAVSGLASHGLGSWKEPGGHNVWLRDFLPNDIPGRIRVLIYGYDTHLLDSKNNGSIADIATSFLSRLKSVRDNASVSITTSGHGLPWDESDPLTDTASTNYFRGTQSWRNCN